MGLTIDMCNARPHQHKHNHKHRHGNLLKVDKNHQPRKASVIVPVPEFLMSSRAVLSAEVPPHPPAALALSAIQDSPYMQPRVSLDAHQEKPNDDIQDEETNRPDIGKGMQTEDLEQTVENNDQDAIHNRTKRSLVEGKEEDGLLREEAHFTEPVCQSRSQWVQKLTSTDVWGNMVYIEQSIDNGGHQVHQYFYETFCEGSDREEGSVKAASCKGIDMMLYDSVCKDQHSWAYAFVTNATGDSGWSLVKIRTSCGCSLISRTPQEAFLDYLTPSIV